MGLGMSIERIMELSIRHSSRVEPYVYKVRLTVHGFATTVYQYYLINIRLMQVEFTFYKLILLLMSKSILIGNIYSLLYKPTVPVMDDIQQLVHVELLISFL